MPEPVAAAPAPQPEAVDPILTAADQAVVSDDVSAYRTARQAERSGTPLAPTPPAPVDAEEPPEPATAEGERKLSKRQQQINDYERRIAEQAAELARLKASSAPAPASPAPRSEPATPAPPTLPPELESYEAYAAQHPDTTYEQFIAARIRAELKHERDQEAAAQTQAQTAQARQARITKFAEQRDAARQADPTFDSRISPDVANLRPIDVLGPDEPVTAMNALAQEIVLSDRPIELMRHFSDHPEDLARIGALPTARELLREMARLEATLSAPPAPASKPVTSAPPPPTTLGSKAADPADETDAAVASGDVARYREARLRQRTAGMR